MVQLQLAGQLGMLLDEVEERGQHADGSTAASGQDAAGFARGLRSYPGLTQHLARSARMQHVAPHQRAAGLKGQVAGHWRGHRDMDSHDVMILLAYCSSQGSWHIVDTSLRGLYACCRQV